MISKEAILHQQVCDYLRLKHPTVLFRTDFAAGIKMTMGQATKHKRLQKTRAWPDLFIAQPQTVPILLATSVLVVAGLFLELKATSPYLKDGVTLKADQHLREQWAVLERLRKLGYKAEFAVGFDQACEIIDGYLGKPARVIDSSGFLF